MKSFGMTLGRSNSVCCLSGDTNCIEVSTEGIRHVKEHEVTR